MEASTAEQQLEIRVKRIGKGEDYLSFFMDATANVLDLKKKISTELQNQTNGDEEDVPTERQRLIFSGRMLRADEERLTDARMTPNAVNCIHLTPLPVGAQPSVRDPARNLANPRAALRGVRQQRRRRRMEDSVRAGVHPYALAVPARSIFESIGRRRGGGRGGGAPFLSAVLPSRDSGANAATNNAATAAPASVAEGSISRRRFIVRSSRNQEANARPAATSTGRASEGPVVAHTAPAVLLSVLQRRLEELMSSGQMQRGSLPHIWHVRLRSLASVGARASSNTTASAPPPPPRRSAAPPPSRRGQRPAARSSQPAPPLRRSLRNRARNGDNSTAR